MSLFLTKKNRLSINEANVIRPQGRTRASSASQKISSFPTIPDDVWHQKKKKSKIKNWHSQIFNFMCREYCRYLWLAALVQRVVCGVVIRNARTQLRLMATMMTTTSCSRCCRCHSTIHSALARLATHFNCRPNRRRLLDNHIKFNFVLFVLSIDVGWQRWQINNRNFNLCLTEKQSVFGD